MDFKSGIHWDASKLNSQPRKMLNTSKARKKFGFCAKINFEQGLKNTIKWYLKSIK